MRSSQDYVDGGFFADDALALARAWLAEHPAEIERLRGELREAVELLEGFAFTGYCEECDAGKTQKHNADCRLGNWLTRNREAT